MANQQNGLSLVMPSHFFNFLFKSSQCHQMKVLNERVSEWPHLILQHEWSSRYVCLKFEKQGIFLGRFFPYEISKTGDKMSDF